MKLLFPSSTPVCKFALLLLSVLSVKGVLAADSANPAEYLLSVYADRSDALYHQGETVRFDIRLAHNQQPAAESNVVWKISKDGVPPIQTGTVTLDIYGKASVSGTLDEPGFLQCQVTYNSGTSTLTALAGAGIDPTEIQPSLPAPDDFDQFWADKIKQLDAVPMNAKLNLVPSLSNCPGVDIFEFQADCIGNPAMGYYARPAGAKPKSCPAVLFVEGAGVYKTDILAAARKAQRGVIALDINAHGIPVNQPKEYYAKLAEGELKDYRYRGRESRETYYFLGMYLRAVRALEFLTTQPEWDGHTLIVEGGSQGGAQSLAATALFPKVTFTFAGVPGQCDITGPTIGRVGGWPRVIPIVDRKPDPKVVEALRYFDGCNFAARIKTPVFGWVGFIDVVCPPTSVYAAYNQLKGSKTIMDDPNRGHNAMGTDIWSIIAAQTEAYIAEQAKPLQRAELKPQPTPSFAH